MVGGIPRAKSALNFPMNTILNCHGRPQICELSPHIQKLHYLSLLHEFDLNSGHATRATKEYLRYVKQTQTLRLYNPFLHIRDARYTCGSTDGGLVREKIRDTDFNHITAHTKCTNNLRSYTYLG